MLSFQNHLQKYQDYLILTNHPDRTQKSYLSHFKKYLEYCISNTIDDPFIETSVSKYLVYRYEQKIDWKTVNIDYSAIKKYFTKVLIIDWNVTTLPRPKSKKEIPDVLSKEDVLKLVEHTSILKYRVLMLFIYGTGMRISEALSVLVKDIDSQRLQIKVRCGKGQKDRYIDVPMELIEILREYYKIYRPSYYLFYGEIKEIPIKERNFQHAVKTAGKKSGLTRDVTPHALRHCYATHHMDNGTNIVYIQKMLGHTNIKTTSIYLHLCVNPKEHQISHPIQDLKVDLLKNIRI